MYDFPFVEKPSIANRCYIYEMLDLETFCLAE